VITYGPNDMVLDNWGQVRSWVATAPVTSHGPSGIGFVNFGDLDELQVQAPISTHGVGGSAARCLTITPDRRRETERKGHGKGHRDELGDA
jgi:hypothetical protein